MVARVVALFLFAACGSAPGERELAPSVQGLSRLAIVATGDTGEGDTDVDTDSDTDSDTDADTEVTLEDSFDTGACLECYTAAELAQDPGGSPCSTGGLAPMALVWLPVLLVSRRRTYSRSYST